MNKNKPPFGIIIIFILTFFLGLFLFILGIGGVDAGPDKGIILLGILVIFFSYYLLTGKKVGRIMLIVPLLGLSYILPLLFTYIFTDYFHIIPENTRSLFFRILWASLSFLFVWYLFFNQKVKEFFSN